MAGSGLGPAPETLSALLAGADLAAPALVVAEDGSALSYGQLAGVDVPHVRTVHACATLLDTVSRGSAARVAQ